MKKILILLLISISLFASEDKGYFIGLGSSVGIDKELQPFVGANVELGGSIGQHLFSTDWLFGNRELLLTGLNLAYFIKENYFLNFSLKSTYGLYDKGGLFGLGIGANFSKNLSLTMDMHFVDYYDIVSLNYYSTPWMSPIYPSREIPRKDTHLFFTLKYKLFYRP